MINYGVVGVGYFGAGRRSQRKSVVKLHRVWMNWSRGMMLTV